MIGYDFTQPGTLFCVWCGGDPDVDHAPCEPAIRNLRLGYCTACGVNVEPLDQQHDACMVFLTGRADLLEPCAEDRAALERLGDAVEAAIDDGTIEAAILDGSIAPECRGHDADRTSTIADHARWN